MTLAPSPPLPRRALLRASLGLPLAAAGCGRAGPGEGFTVGYLNNLTHAQALVGVASGRWARALGARFMAFPAGPAVMEALASGSIQAGFMGPSAAVNAFVRSKGKRGLVLSGGASGGASLVVRTKSGIRGPEHLRGRVLTASQIASTPDIAMRAYLSASGLAPLDRGGDVTLIPMPNSEALALMKHGQLDGSWAQEPWASRMVAQAGCERLLDERDLWPGGRFSTSLLVTDRRTLTEQPRQLERLVALLDDETTRMKRLADGGVGETADALARVLGKRLPEPVLRDAWGRLELTTDLLPSAIDEVARRMRAIGYLPPGSLDGLAPSLSPRASLPPSSP